MWQRTTKGVGTSHGNENGNQEHNLVKPMKARRKRKKKEEIKENIGGRLFLHESNKRKMDLRETEKNGPPPRRGMGSLREAEQIASKPKGGSL